MVEISNKTLALMLLAAIVLTLGGTMISLNKLSTVINSPGMTGYAVSTSTGQANVSIQTSASLTFVVNRLQFGLGAVNGTNGNTVCNLASGQDGAGAKDSNTKCVGFNAANTFNNLEIENDGNLNFTLNISNGGTTAAAYIGGPSGLEAITFKVANNESNSCGSPLPLVWSTMNTTSMLICPTTSGGFGFVKANNSMDIYINITIPYDSIQTGTDRILTITATGTSM